MKPLHVNRLVFLSTYTFSGHRIHHQTDSQLPDPLALQKFSKRNHYQKLLLTFLVLCAGIAGGCQSNQDFVSKSKSELAHFEKWCWGKSFKRDLKYDLSGMTWKTEVSVTPDGHCRRVIRQNDHPRKTNLTIGEFCNSREGWLLSTSDKKFVGLSSYQITFAKEGRQSAGLSIFAGDLPLGIAGGKSISDFVEESTIEKVYQEFGGKKLEGIACDHSQYPTTSFFFDDDHQLKYIEVVFRQGDLLQETKFGKDQLYEDTASEKVTYGPIQYAAFESQRVPESYRVIQEKKSVQQGVSVTISGMTVCKESYENEIPFPDHLLVSGRQVHSKAADGQMFSIQNNRLVHITSNGAPNKLNKKRPSKSWQKNLLWFALASLFLVTGILWTLRSFSKKKNTEEENGEENLD